MRSRLPSVRGEFELDGPPHDWTLAAALGSSLYTQRPRSRDSPTLNREADVGFVESVDDLPLGLHLRETTSTARYQSNSHECPRQACYRR